MERWLFVTRPFLFFGREGGGLKIKRVDYFFVIFMQVLFEEELGW